SSISCDYAGKTARYFLPSSDAAENMFGIIYISVARHSYIHAVVFLCCTVAV
ncbi:hypothetical protein A2U01_0022390, partial [Trifolium medium]|nr:hypothetical protein [Trifolium medium]